jgi:hypothetical protein
MSQVITVLGGNGFIGTKCITTLLKNVKDVKIYAVCRSGIIKNSEIVNDSRVKIIKGDCLYPKSFENEIKESTGFIHSIGVLFTNDNNKYHLMNKETCLRVASIANEGSNKANFVYVSAQRGIPFPLSLKYHGYIESKRECEKSLLQNYSKLNPIILRPGFVKSSEKSWTVPIYMGVNVAEFGEKKILDRVFPGAGEKLQLPSRGIEIDTLANFAVAGALGKLKPFEIYSNEYLLNTDNKVRL